MPDLSHSAAPRAIGGRYHRARAFLSFQWAKRRRWSNADGRKQRGREVERERGKCGCWHGHHEVQPVASSLFRPLQLNLAVASDADGKEREEAAVLPRKRSEYKDKLVVGWLAKVAVASRKEEIQSF